jgi:hypothetical protein
MKHVVFSLVKNPTMALKEEEHRPQQYGRCKKQKKKSPHKKWETHLAAWTSETTGRAARALKSCLARMQ